MAIGVMYKCKQYSDVAPVIARIGQRHTHLPPDFHLPAMPAQDKKTTEANARALRELLRQPDNKVCADCKRNGACHTAPNYPSLTPLARSTLGLVESVSPTVNGSDSRLIPSFQRRIFVHSMLWHSPVYGDTHQQSQICRSRLVDAHST